MANYNENKEPTHNEYEDNMLVYLEAEFGGRHGDEDNDLMPPEESLMSLRDFLSFLDPDAVLEWNSRAQMAEGHFTLNGERYRIVTTAGYVYVGDFETNLGRAFPRHVIDQVSFIYPSPILRFLDLPENMFDPETVIIEGVAGNRFVILEVPVTIDEVSEYAAESYINIAETGGILDSSDGAVMNTIEQIQPLGTEEGNLSTLTLVNTVVIGVIMGLIVFYKKGKLNLLKLFKSREEK